ncbi:MAG TPA: 50S ribosomal protein L23 [Candidatus Paceibacterota bacterium]
MATISIHNHLIIRPRITEKSGMMSESLNLYTFEVQKSATKGTISKAIKSLYKVNPIKIRIINLPAKQVITKGKKGMQSPIKKALVYLRKGDKIEFI